ncbi:MAG: hypothetical protein M3177_02835 [Pseudomonadota bacterium]|nr:hypothetical protein [Pseudomonadota bacterium]
MENPVVNVAELADEAGISAIEVQNMALIRADRALHFLSYLRGRNLEILGIEAFFFEDGYVLPDMEHILDLSGLSSGDSLSEASNFLSNSGIRPDQLLSFEFK